MNGDMPHVPITSLAGIAGLTDLLNQLPLPSPLPGTTTKSLLYSGRVAEEVGRLMDCRDETLVSQLANGLSQVSTEHIELKDSLGSDELEGDVPVLLQLLVSRNPSIFRNKTAQQSMAPPYKITHGSMQGSPVSANYQASMSHSPSGRFVPGQSGSGGRFLPQQSSPVPSPYAPQSPATSYRQYPHPPAYSQHQHLQQGSVASPMIPGGMRNVHENKVFKSLFCINSQVTYRQIFSMRAGFTSHILQSSPPYTPPCDGAQELHLGSPDKQRGLKPNEGERDSADKAAVYDIVGSPAKDPTKLILRQSRARPAEVELGGMYPGSDPEGELVEALAAIERMESEAAMETERGAKEVQDKGMMQDKEELVLFSKRKLSLLCLYDPCFDIIFINKNPVLNFHNKNYESDLFLSVDKPLKKRKQDSHPQEPGGANAGHRLAPQEASAAGTSASRPGLQVSLEQVGRVEDTYMGMPIPASEAQRWPQEPQEGVTPKALKHKHDHAPEHRHQPDTPRQKHRSEVRHGDASTQRAAQSGSKPVELPPYMLGENTSSGVLKNTIPKIRKDLGGGDIPEGWKQPCVRLERLEPEMDMKKTVKPVVVLQKLSIDEVQRFMRERDSRGSKSGKNRLSSGRSGKGGIDPSVLKDLPPELLAEIESTMPLCERVKMNKRKRSTVNERPKYAEDSSEDEEYSSRKRQKKDRDRTWEFEERDQRSSGEHRRGSYDARRGSGSRYDDSDQDSPPPSLSDVARRLKTKEKQKKRKAYEPKLTPEEMMDSSTFKRFSLSIDNILENLEDVDFNAQDDDEIPQELLLGKQQLSELSSESAKIKAMGITCRIPSDKLVKLLSILEKNILDGANLSTLVNHDNDGEDEERLWRDLIMERVTKSADACLTALNIMTSSHMPKAVYIEDVIERVLQYTKFHLQNTLYPQYDPVYRVDPKGGSLLSSKAKRAKCSTAKQRVIIMLYNKVCEVVSNISELLEIQLMTDTTILQVSSMGITPFFVENVSELQLCAIKLVTAVFSRYEKHRQLILEEIFTSLARLPTSKRSLRNFRLNSSDAEGEPIFIQMVSALVLQLIQCVVHLPSEKDSEDDHKKVDDDVFITNSYETARRTAQNFLSVFLKKCGSKQGEEDYRPLFENFVQDLLSTVNKPEWPASELLLSLLGRLLVHQFSNKQTEMALRVASLDYLGTVAARLRKDSVTSRMDQKAIDCIIRESSEGDETQRLQKALLDYMNENAETDPALTFARKFYIAQWFRDCTTEAEKAMRNQNQKEDDSEGTQHAKELQATGDIMQRAETRKKFLHIVIKSIPSQFTTLRMNSDTVDYEDACLIVRYLASTRPFSQSFDIYLTQILRVLGESAIAVRTKAMKCLSEVVAVDPSILARSDMQRGVHGRLMDNSTSVREAAVELLGRFVLSRPQLTEQYYDMLIERILDTGISVRKRVIKILRDICLEQPNFSKITEMCVKMIRRVNDEEGIKKLVNETFQKLWFTPTANHDKETMNRKILNITDVVAACKDTGYDWFEQLLQNLLKSEEDSSYKPARKACVQLVDNLVEYILKYEEALAEHKSVNSTRLVACITTLYLFSKIRPQLMVKHAMTMQPYLTTKCSSQSDFMVICNVAKILELVVPLMDHPSENFLTTIEEDLMKLILKYGMTVVQYCVSCLGSIVNKVTHNYKFVWACFNRYYGALTKLKLQHQEGTNSMALAATKAALLRSLFTVGALCRHFDFDLEQFKVNCVAFVTEPMFVPEVKSLYNGLLSDKRCSITLKIQVLKNLQMYLQEEDSRMQEADREWQKLSKQEDLKEMGDISSGMSSSIMQLYLKQVLESFFHTQSSVRHFALNVIALTLSQGLIHPVQCVPYLIAMGTDPEPTMRNKADQQLVEIDKKYTGFIHMKAVAGMKMSFQVQQAVLGSAGSVIRGFRQDESHSAQCSHLYSMIRTNRQHRRAFLISLLNLFDDSSKIEVNMLLFIADNLAYFPYQSQEEPLFIMHHIDITLSVSGSNLLQTFKEVLVKGDDDGDAATNNEEYDNDDYEEDEEGQRVRKPKPTEGARQSESDSDTDLEDADAVMERLPDDTTSLLDFARASQGILLLLVLKQHLKNLYGFSDSKIQKYSPTESAKVYDKAVNRKSSVNFSPRQTIDFLHNDEVHDDMTYELKRKIVKQYLDFKLLMEHLDPDEEDEEGETSANVRNKAITALLGGAGTSPRNHHTVDSEDEDSDGEERTPGASRRGRRATDSADLLSTNMNESVSALDIIAIHCPKYRDRPQIARVIQRNSDGYSIHWMAGSYSSSWTEAKRRDGRKLVPWVDTIRETDIIYKKITLTSGNKLNHKVAQTLRSLYAAKDRNSS
uniref:Nipped-B protein n=1 Tax=Cyprinus carpio TaxID=7962 RepID=A0A8C1LVP8_CYPCA